MYLLIYIYVLGGKYTDCTATESSRHANECLIFQNTCARYYIIIIMQLLKCRSRVLRRSGGGERRTRAWCRRSLNGGTLPELSTAAAAAVSDKFVDVAGSPDDRMNI